MSFDLIDRAFKPSPPPPVVRRGVPDFIREGSLRVEPVGSRVTCYPAPTDTDEDWLILLPSNVVLTSAIKKRLFDEGWDNDGSFISDDNNRTPAEEQFTSYSLDDINMIVTCSPVFFRRFMAASSVAKRLNLLKKADRIAVFQAVLYGNEWEEDFRLSDDLVEF